MLTTYRKIAIILLFVFFILIGFFLFLLFFDIKIKKNISYFVQEGYGLFKIADDLEKNGVISSAFKFKIYSKFWILVNGCVMVQFGEYNLNTDENYADVLDKFCNGKTVWKTITIPEGTETRDIIRALNENKDLTGKKIVFFEEGVFLPETYSFQSGVKRESIFLKMQQDFNVFLESVWSKREPNDFIKTKQDAIILASIVEKEAKTDEERPIIASVYLNRLSIDMKLEADPTTIYEITKGRYKLNRLLTREDLKVKGDYNTYSKKGLPIAPICNPGVKSILAVLYPASTDYLYFVAKADLSGHIFANNYKDHLKNIKMVKSQKSGK